MGIGEVVILAGCVAAALWIERKFVAPFLDS